MRNQNGFTLIELVVVIVILANANADFLISSIIVVDRQLTLLMDWERGIIEALVVWPGFLDIAHVPFADMRGVVTGL